MPRLFHTLLITLSLMINTKVTIPDSKRAADIRNKVWPILQKQLKDKGLGEDQPVYIRIIKETKTKKGLAVAVVGTVKEGILYVDTMSEVTDK